MRSRIMVVGSINMDLVVSCERMPRPGETLVGNSFSTIPGGKGANQAVAATRLGAQVWMVGRVGADEFGGTLLRSLENDLVDTTYLACDRELPTGVAVITVTASGENSIIVAPGANSNCSPEDVDKALEALGRVDAVLLQLEIPLATVEYTLHRAREVGAMSILDAGPARECPSRVWTAADIVSPNEHEASALTGLPLEDIESAHAVAEAMLHAGARQVVLKLGERGCLVATTKMQEHLPAYLVRAVDATAAGDAFTAALAVVLCRGATLVEAAREANLAGALATTKLGAQTSLPTMQEMVAAKESESFGSKIS